MSGTYIIRASTSFIIADNQWETAIGSQAGIAEATWPPSAGGAGIDKTACNFYNNITGPGSFRLHFDGDQTAIYVDGAPVSFGSLPSGFLPTSAFVSGKFTGPGGGFLTFEFDATTVDTEFPFTTSPTSHSFTWPGIGIPSILSLLNNGFGVTFRIGTFSSEDIFIKVSDGQGLYIHGSYIIASWYYNPTTNHYQFTGSNPGPPWILQSPTLTVTRVTPDTDTIAGGTAVIVDGTGFADNATITFGGASATSVVVLDQTKLTCVTPAHASGYVTVTVTNPDTTTGSLANGYLYVEPVWWNFGDFWFLGYQPPSIDWELGGFPWVKFPPFRTIQQWLAAGNTMPGTVPADTKGWWGNSANFAGASEIVATPGNPQHARGWDKIVALATGNAAMLGGSPAASVTFHNHIIYAGDDYTLGSTNPTIRIFDGQSDHLMAKLPNTSSGAAPKCIVSMLGVGDVIYVSTLDSGTSSSDFAGRIFSFDPFSNILTPVATGFSSGEIPYAMAWHMNRLWIGTNKGNGTPGKIYFIRPDIDTAWTLDYTLTTSSVGGATSLLSYNGLLYVGTDNVDASRGKVLVRSTIGVYTTSDTGTGGTAKVNNGYLAMKQLGNNLYASYWNPDATAISIIKKFDGTTWTTAYTGSSTTLRPYILMFVTNNTLFAVGGGDNLSGSLVYTVDGSAWTNATTNLSGPTTETTMPIFGLVSF